MSRWTGAARRDGLLLALLIAVTSVGLAVRLFASRCVGFGDSEALYASYALFPAPAHLDHPGAIGLIMALLGDGAPPSPSAVHVWTSIAASLAPWAFWGAARLLGATTRRALLGALAVAAAPEIAVGLFGMTPDLPLFFAWLASSALFCAGVRSPPSSPKAVACFMSAGLALGIACASKVSGLTLLLALALASTRPPAREHARTLWPWAGLALALVIFAPVVAFETRSGFPMLHHRLVATQRDAGVSLRNAAAIVVGQLVYVSPVLAIAGGVAAKRLIGERNGDAARGVLAWSFVVPAVILGGVALWSRVAEPHWLAPAWLALALAWTVGPTHAPRWPLVAPLGIGLALALSGVVYAWVLTPWLAAWVPASAYQPRLDIANELFGWPAVLADVRETAEAARSPLSDPRDVVVVGPVWTVCAQLRAGLPPSLPVGCQGDNVADFALWNPPRVWSRADTVVFVHDNRQPADSASLFPDRVVIGRHTTSVMRAGRVARVFTIEVLSRRAAG